MSSVADKPDVRERLGTALNSRDLEHVEEKTGAVELLGALGFSQTNPDGVEHEKHEFATIDPGTELAGVLIRLKYGGERSARERVIRLLITWVRHQRAYRKWKLRPHGESVFEKFVRSCFDEWVDPVCRICCGRQMLGLERGAIVSKRLRCKRCRGRGEVDQQPETAPFREYVARPVRRSCSACHGMGSVTIQRSVREKPGICWSCKGTGLHRPNPAEHSLALGVDVKVYERHWAKRFSWLGGALDRLDHTEKRCLQVQMEHGIKHS
jgi:hypothetical protein